MKLSVHVDLSLCDEARQVSDGVGDIYKDVSGGQGSWRPGILILGQACTPLGRLCGWVGLCQSEMAWI